MPYSAKDQLVRQQRLLAAAQQDYDLLQYIMLEGAVEVTVRSCRHSVSIPITGEPTVHINGYLQDYLLQLVKRLEGEVDDWHNQVVQEGDDERRDADELADYRQQARHPSGPGPGPAASNGHDGDGQA